MRESISRYFRQGIQKIPLLRACALKIRAGWLKLTFKDAAHYWQQRYAKGGTSGAGSRGRLAQYKADVINRFMEEHAINTSIEFGCGDGYQLGLINYKHYTGLDISKKSITLCQTAFSADHTKSFYLYHPQAFCDKQGLFRAELSLSLDVIYHITEDQDYDKYLHDLFHAAIRYVMLYSSNAEYPSNLAHIKHRKISADIQARFPDWLLLRQEENPHAYQPWDDTTSLACFLIYTKASAP